jgi:DNA polymerase I-like protein with 3'-5' exonuclease and polymerase domains
MLEGGRVWPLHTRYGLAGTGRSTSSKPNIQNQSNRDGFREAFVARPGYVFVQNDYPTLELYTLAQCCISWFGFSKLAEALRLGDPHLWVASIILNKPLEWCIANKKSPEVQQARKLAKPANFGLPGGMGDLKFVTSTRKSLMKLEGGREEWEALKLTEGAYIDEKGKQRYPRVAELREFWMAAFPEMNNHFGRIRNLTGESDDGLAMVETLFTGRWRGKATYCATANNGFQALGSDCAKNAVWKVAEAQYTNRQSPLFNTRTVAFVHDELILECKDDGRAHDVAFELARVMADAANEFLPDIPIPVEKMEPTVMYRWSKKAKQSFDDNMRLIAWAA